MGWIFVVLWPIGFLLVYVALMYAYRVPQMAARKLTQSSQRAFLRYCMANCFHHSIPLDPDINDDLDIYDQNVSDETLQALVLGSKNVRLDYDPALRQHEWFKRLLINLSKMPGEEEESQDEIEEQHKKIKLKTRVELLELLEDNKALLENAQIVTCPPICWDGTSGAEEKKAISHLGLMLEAYECQFWWFEAFEMVRKLLLVSVLVNFVNDSATSYVTACFVLSFLALMITGFYKPFVSPLLDQLQTFSLATSCLTYFYGLTLAMNIDTTNTNETTVQSVIMSVLSIAVIVMPVIAVWMRFGKAILKIESYFKSKIASSAVIAGTTPEEFHRQESKMNQAETPKEIHRQESKMEKLQQPHAFWT